MGGAPSSSDRAAVVTAYYDQILRDWAWQAEGNNESDEARAAVLEVWPERDSARRVAILGAGACRLAYDLHRAMKPTLTVAIDINPLPMLVARALLSGSSVALYEFPVSPPSILETVVDHLLSPPADVEGLELVIADALALPVVAGSFDVVVTPWFIDQVPDDIGTFLPDIDRLLHPDGLWINHGPLIYDPRRSMVSQRYRADEVAALAALGGFEIVSSTQRPMKYMDSPYGTQTRIERVWTFGARKVHRVPT
jgi:hypothetical protein